MTCTFALLKATTLIALGVLLTVTTAHAKEISRVVLLGGSSVATTYLPEATKHHNVLTEQLKASYPQQEIEVENWADNGESIARYLLNGAYEKQRANPKGIDIAIIRFGTNDQKLMEIDEYSAQMLKLIALLQQDFPGIKIVLETGIYLDYPKHYPFDRNKILQPYWEVSREIAKKSGYPLVEYYETGKTETKAGNWDIRIRTQAGKQMILDDSQDVGKENDSQWFFDIHPNPRGVQLAVREEVGVLKKTFPEQFPAGQIAVERSVRDAEYYSKFLNFDAERLVRKKKANPEKTLQDATK